MIDRDHRDLRKPRDADCTKSVPVMTEALASTPESRRYVFCLAQSYGNAGRMGRGGVYARLQEARCCRWVRAADGAGVPIPLSDGCRVRGGWCPPI